MDSGRNNKYLHFRRIRCRCPTTKDDSYRHTVASLPNCHFFDKLMTSFNSFNKAQRPSEPVGELDLVSSGPFSAWLHPAVSTIKPTSPASPSLPDEKIARSRADDGILRQAPSSNILIIVKRSRHHNTILRNAGTIFRSLLCPLPLPAFVKRQSDHPSVCSKARSNGLSELRENSVFRPTKTFPMTTLRSYLKGLTRPARPAISPSVNARS